MTSGPRRLRRAVTGARRRLHRARVGLRGHVRSLRTSPVETATGTADEAAGAVVVPDEPLPREPVARPEVVAAVLAGDRLRAGLALEWTQVEPEPGSWRSDLDPRPPDLVVVEAGPALAGWTLETSTALQPTDQLDALLGWARDRGVPTVAWVTEPGPAAAARARELGERVDRVATVDPATVADWQTRVGPERVLVLGPAAQPRLHSPATAAPTPPGLRRPYDLELVLDEPGDSGERAGATAGAADPLTALVEPSLRLGVHVWAGQSGVGSVPAAFRRRTVATLPYARLARLPAQYKVALDVGDPGRAVPAWRVLEAGAAQTPVVTTPFGDVEPGLADALVVGTDPVTYRRQAGVHVAHQDLRDRAGLRLHRAVLDRHTYSHRVDALLGAAGRPAPVPEPSVTAVVPTNRPHRLDAVFAAVARQSHRPLELVLVLHGLDLDTADVATRAKEAGVGDVQVLTADRSLTLGACMNLGVDAAGGRYLAKMDDDNVYGEHYLRDLVRAFSWTDAGVVGKWSHYVWLEASGAVVLRYEDFEHTYTRLVQGGSMVVDGDLARELRFSDIPRAVDTDFLTRSGAAGVRTYAADRFNYVSVRSASTAGHTWQVSDVEILTGSARLAFFGDPRPHVEV